MTTNRDATVTDEAVTVAAREAGISTYEARAALTAAAPIIRAEALREAADMIDAQRDATNPGTRTDVTQGVIDHSDGRFLGKVAASRILRARADTIEGATP